MSKVEKQHRFESPIYKTKDIIVLDGNQLKNCYRFLLFAA
jgi:hypothetical protein